MSAIARLMAEDGGVKLANLVTLARGVLILPILLFLAEDFAGAALVLYLLACATDIIDGRLARASGRASSFGAQLDAVIDNVFSLAILFFLVLAFPDLTSHHWFALAILFGGPILYLFVSYILAGRILMFHFWSAKFGALLLFALWPLLAVSDWEGFISVAATVVGFSRLEQIVFILRGGTDEDATHCFVWVAR